MSVIDVKLITNSDLELELMSRYMSADSESILDLSEISVEDLEEELTRRCKDKESLLYE